MKKIVFLLVLFSIVFFLSTLISPAFGAGSLQAGPLKNSLASSQQDHEAILGSTGSGPLEPNQAADLELSKIVNNSAPLVGSSVTFTVTLVNRGPDQTTGVMVYDALPDGYTLTGSTPSPGTSYTAGDWNVGTLDADGSATLELVATVQATGTYDNFAEVTASATLDPDSTPNNHDTTEDDYARVVVTPVPVADLELNKTVTNAAPYVGGSVTFTLTLVNKGPSQATGVVVHDALPDGYISTGLTPSQGTSYAAGDWNVGTLNAGGSAILQLAATVLATGSYTNYAEVSVSPVLDPDSTPNNGSTAEDDDATVVVTPVPVADLELSKTVTNAMPYMGSSVTFMLTLVNKGPSQATGVVVHDALPNGYTLTGSTPSPGTSYAAGNWNVGTLNAGGSATLQLAATVLATGSYTNYAEVTASGVFDPDSTPNNGSTMEDDDATVVVTPVPAADLELTKIAATTTPYVESTATFTLTLVNKGPSQATNVQVKDSLPSGYVTGPLTYVASQGTYNKNSGLWNVGPVSLNNPVTLRITAPVKSSGVYNNYTQVIAATEHDPDSTPNNNSTTEDDDDTLVMTPIIVADLELSKTVTNAMPDVGKSVTFLLMLVNQGPGQATAVVVHDALPDGYTLTGSTPSPGTSYAAGNWNVGTLDAGGSATLQLVATVLATGAYTNYAEVTASAMFDPDSTPNNNSTTEDDDATVVVTPVPAADLELTKIANTTTPQVGSSVVFTLTLVNKGPSQATGVVVHDALPNGYTLTGFTPSPGSSYAAGYWNVGTLNAGGSATLQLAATVLATGSYTNYAEVSVSPVLDPDSTPNNGSTAEDDDATVVVTPVPVADLELNKTVTNATPYMGSSVTFMLTLVNKGPSQATGVVVHDALPNGYTLTGSTPSAGTSYAAGNWNVGTLNAGGSATLQLAATVLATGSYMNYAEVSVSPVLDPDSTPNNGSTAEDDDATVMVTPVPAADLELSKTLTSGTPYIGGSVTFALTLVNKGPSQAIGVVVHDALPNGYTLTGSTPSPGTSYAAGNWNVGTLNAGASATLELVATVLATGSYTNYAEVTASEVFDPDSTPNNASTTEDDDATVVVMPVPAADLELIKSALTTTPYIGQTATFTLTLTNKGPSQSTGIQVTDLLPTGYNLAAIIATPSQGTYNTTTGLWNIGTLAPTAIARLRIIAPVLPAGPYNNTARVTAFSGTDPVATNNTSTITVAPVLNADLFITKTDSPDPVNAGADLTYNLIVSNAGPSASQNVVLTDTIPTGVTLKSVVGGTGWTCNPPVAGKVRCTLAGLNVSTSAPPITMMVTVNSSTTGVITNMAVVKSATIDLTTSNNSSTATTTVQSSADLSITKIATPEPVAETEVLTYTLTITNNGPSTASGVSMQENIPSRVQFLSASVIQGSATCSGSGPVTCNLGNMVNGSIVKINVLTRARTVSNVPRTATNTATVTASTPDPNTTNNTASQTTSILPAADLQLGMISSSAQVQTGSLLTYTLTITNTGPSTATNLVVTDTLPVEMTYISSSNPPFSTSSHLVVWHLGSLSPAGVLQFKLVVRADSKTQTLVNQAMASADQRDLVYADSIDQVSLQVIDSVPPTISWFFPWQLGQYYQISSDMITLVATAKDNVGIDRVRFYRYDEPSSTWKDIGYDYTSSPCFGNPSLQCYDFTFSMSVLNPRWNEIHVRAIDTSGLFSTLPSPHLFIYRIVHQIFLPVVRK